MLVAKAPVSKATGVGLKDRHTSLALGALANASGFHGRVIEESPAR
jgi:hypothetical protein